MSEIIFRKDQTNPIVRERTEHFFQIVMSQRRDSDLIEWVNKGIYIEARDSSGITPLHLAAMLGRTETAKALLAAGAEMEVRSDAGLTALNDAAAQGRLEVIEVLLASGANIEARTNLGNTPLLNAVNTKIQDESVIKAFLAKGANVYARNAESWEMLNDVRVIMNKELQDYLNIWRHEYFRFIAHSNPPASAERVYHYLAMTPLADPCAPVDYAGNLRRIFTHAKWQDKSHAENMLKEMKADGMISAETCESIMAATFPPTRCRPQPRLAGVAI